MIHTLESWDTHGTHTSKGGGAQGQHPPPPQRGGALTAVQPQAPDRRHLDRVEQRGAGLDQETRTWAARMMQPCGSRME